MTVRDQQVAAQMRRPCRTVVFVILTHRDTRTRTQWPRMHTESTDPLVRPGQRCFKSSGSPQSHNCSDRIGSEMRVGTKNRPAVLEMSQTPCSTNAGCRSSCNILDRCSTELFFLPRYLRPRSVSCHAGCIRLSGVFTATTQPNYPH